MVDVNVLALRVVPVVVVWWGVLPFERRKARGEGGVGLTQPERTRRPPRRPGDNLIHNRRPGNVNAVVSISQSVSSSASHADVAHGGPHHAIHSFSRVDLEDSSPAHIDVGRLGGIDYRTGEKGRAAWRGHCIPDT